MLKIKIAPPDVQILNINRVVVTAKIWDDVGLIGVVTLANWGDGKYDRWFDNDTSINWDHHIKAYIQHHPDQNFGDKIIEAVNLQIIENRI